MPQNGPLETGYWNPAVVTDAKGEATLTITMPDQSTAWTLEAKGASAQTLAGEAKTELTAKKDLFGELKLPAAFTDGDETQILATIHNGLVEKGQIQVTLKTTIGGKSVEEKKTIDVTAKGISELAFPTVVKRGEAETAKPPSAKQTEAPVANDTAIVELTVAAGDDKDVVRRIIPIHPYGMPIYGVAAGSASSDTTVWVELPQISDLKSQNLQILVGPTIQRSLLDVLFGPAPACQYEAAMFASGLDSTTSDLLAGLALQKLLATTRDATGPHAQALDARIRASTSLLISSQQEDGGWSWTGGAGGSHRLTSARAVWALAMAKAAGYKLADDRLEKALTYLQSQVAATGETDYESKAILLHALAVAGRGDFTLANRLYRNRPALSSAALAHVALALAAMDHKPMAEDLLKMLGATAGLSSSAAGDTAGQASSGTRALPWDGSAVELRALYALALEEATPDSPKLKEQIDWLMAHRTGNVWSRDMATGPARRWPLAGWFGKAKF